MLALLRRRSFAPLLAAACALYLLAGAASPVLLPMGAATRHPVTES